MIREVLRHFCTVTVLVAFLAITAFGSTFHSGDRVHITNLHQIDGDLYAFGETITIDGTVDGDFISGAYQINSNGEITGSANLSAYEISHSGSIDGSLRAFANSVRISGDVGRSVVACGGEITIEQRAKITKDVTIYGGRATIDGSIGENLDFKGGKIFISGEIDGDVHIIAEEITIASQTIIKGNLTYEISDEKDFDLQEGVVIYGETTREEYTGGDEIDEDSEFKSFVLSLSLMLSAFLFGIILISMFRRYAEASVEQMRSRFGMCIATGILTSLIVAASVLILALSVLFSIIGLTLVGGDAPPVGALMLILSSLLIPISAFTSVTGGILFYSGKIIAALILGFMIVNRFKSEAKPFGKVQLLLGLCLLTAVYAIPYVGLLISLVVSLGGAGAIVFGVRSCRPSDNNTEMNASPQPGSQPPPAPPAVTPPPTSDA